MMSSDSRRPSHTGHLRQRSVTANTAEEPLLARCITPNYASDDDRPPTPPEKWSRESYISQGSTVVDFGDAGSRSTSPQRHGPRYGPKEGDDTLAWREGYSRSDGRDDAGGRSGAIDAERRKRETRAWARRRLIQLTLLGTVVALSWLAGKGSRKEEGLPREVEGVLLSGEHAAAPVCNPYDQHGVLLVNETVSSENQWAPIAAPASCQPIDYMTLLLDSVDSANSAEVEFMRNRTIVIFGDSVDRDHNHHFCDFANGRLEMIHDTHPFSPPYPKGQELPPADYKNFVDGTRTWPNFDQSRPWICHIEHLNLRLLNVFHYGFRPETTYITHHPHYYPPATIEDRFDQIVQPIVASMAKEYGTSAVPDILSMTPGFWGIMRRSQEQQAEADKLVKQGATADVAWKGNNPWGVMSPVKREWLEKRVEESMRYLAKGWRDDQTGVGLLKPQLLWRTLHHINVHTLIPYGKVQTVDQIGKSVIDRLVSEGVAAEAGSRSWLAWKEKAESFLGGKGWHVSDSEALAGQLGRRLKFDNWGALMLGQQDHFRDAIHPLPLPGSYLWGNMMLHQLKLAVDARQTV